MDDVILLMFSRMVEGVGFLFGAIDRWRDGRVRMGCFA